VKKRATWSDWWLVVSVGAGLFFSPATLPMLVIPFLRRGWSKFRWGLGYSLLLTSVLWALMVVAIRGPGDSVGTLLFFAFLWLIPFALLIYQPQMGTVRLFKLLVCVLLALDLAFNLYALTTGQDFLGRTMDPREGLAGGRLGGLFAHSFYSGTISTLAYVFLLCSKRARWLAAFAAANLLLAGSLRLAIPIVLVPLFAWRWQARTRTSELLQVVAFSVLIVLGTFATSSFADLGLEANPANDMRIFAWVTSIDTVSGSPLIGIGYPKQQEAEAINTDTIQELLIGESWYFNSAMTFGIPYALLRLAGLLAIFYGSRFKRRTQHEAVLAPFILIDLAYGEAFQGLLFYSVLWVVIAHVPYASKRRLRKHLDGDDRPKGGGFI
jgi:hypothetical protein